MAYKLSRAERHAVLSITLPNRFEDPKTGRIFYKDHVTVHDPACSHVRPGTSNVAHILLGQLLKGPRYLKKRFMLEVEPPVKWCKQCMKNKPYEALMPGPNIDEDFDEDDFIASIERGKGKEANQWSTSRSPTKKDLHSAS